MEAEKISCDTLGLPVYRSRHCFELAIDDGLLSDLSTDRHPTRVYAWGHSGCGLALGDEGTHFGFVVSGNVSLSMGDPGTERSFGLGSKMYFCVPGSVSIQGGSGVVVTRLGYYGLFMVGGPTEERGRLRYIDGCSDTLLVPPVRRGDPCLNYLHFPARVVQTRHTHPSVRVAVVARGAGRCIVPANEDGSGADVTIPLVPGRVFVIPADGHHSFMSEDQTMDIIAYHPDSDVGPDDDNHPMVNRTLVGGVSAAAIPTIRTAEIR